MSEPRPESTEEPLPLKDLESGKATATTATTTTTEVVETSQSWPTWIIPKWIRTLWATIEAPFLGAFDVLFIQRSDGRGLLLLLICGLLLIPHAFLVYRWPHGDYGIGVLNEHFLCGSHGEAFMIFLIQLPINAMASLIVYAAGYIRWKACWPMKVVLFLVTIPAHLL